MTKKDYLAIGKALRKWGVYEEYQEKGSECRTSRKGVIDRKAIFQEMIPGVDGQYPSPVLEVAEFLADVFEADNPQFNRARFLRYVKTGKEDR